MHEGNETSYFATSSITLHGARLGEGPLVVYLHGITANWAVWRPILQGMAGETTGVAVSQRGHGRSDKPATGYTGSDFAQDVIDLIELLNLGPAIIVGHSLGARNAAVVAARRPDLVRGVLSVDFVPNTGVNELQVLADRVSGGDRDFDGLDDVRAYLSGRYRLMPADAVARRADHGYVATSTGTLRPLADGEAMTQTAAGLFEPYPDEYREVKAPMVALRGEMSTLISPVAFEDAARIRPDVPHLTIPRVDHYIPEENAAVIIEYIRALLLRSAPTHTPLEYK